MTIPCFNGAAVFYCYGVPELTVALREYDLACARCLNWLTHHCCVVHAWMERLYQQDWVLLLTECEEDITRGQGQFRFV
jgi:hypothetical protein